MRRLGNGRNEGLIPHGFESLWPSDFFGDFFNDGFGSFSSGMKADIRETDKDYIIDVEVPGMKKDDVEISVNDNMLTISAKVNEEHEEKGEGRYLRRERRSGVYRRSFALDNIKSDAIKAKMDSGVLTVTLPKLEQRVITDRKIDID